MSECKYCKSQINLIQCNYCDEILDVNEIEAAAFERGRAEGWKEALDQVIALLMKELHDPEYKSDGTMLYLVDLVEQLKPQPPEVTK